MNKKIIKGLFALVAIIIIIVSAYFLLSKEIPVLNKTITAGQVITENDITTKRVFKTDGFVVSSSDLIGKEAVSTLEANQPIVSILLETPQEETGEIVDSSDEFVVIQLNVDASRMPSLNKGDLVYLATFFDAGAIQNESSFNIVYPTIAIVERGNQVSDDGTTVTNGVQIKINKDYVTHALFAQHYGQIYLIKTNDTTPENFEGSSAYKQYVEFYNEAVENEVLPYEENVEIPVEEVTE